MHPIAFQRYLLLPLHTASLLLIVSFSVLLTFGEHAGIFGIPVFVIIGSWFFKYGFTFLDHAMEGHREPPIFSYEMANPLEQRPLGLFLLLIIFYAMTTVFERWLGHTSVTMVRIVLLGLVPAIVASMSATGSFFGGLNPITVVGTIARIPVAYGLLLVVIGGLWFVPFWFLRSMSKQLSGVLTTEAFYPWHIFGTTGIQGFIFAVLGAMLFMYVWLAMFACIGGTVYEQRHALEFDAAASPERKAARFDVELNRERDKIMDRVFAETRGGASANAGATVRKLIETAPDPLDECRWLYARAAAATNQNLAEYLAQISVPRLLSVRANGEVLKLLRERLNLNGDFRPTTSEQLLQVARLARDAGDRAMARRLLENFERFFPNDKLTEVVAMLASELQR